MYHCFSCGASGRLAEFEANSIGLTQPNCNRKKHYEEYPTPSALDQTKIREQAKPKPLKPRIKPDAEHTRRSQRFEEWQRARAALKASESQEVATYLQNRGISLATARQSGLGYVSHYRFSLHKPVSRPVVGTNSFPSAETAKPQLYYEGAVLFPLYDEVGLVNYYARGLNQRLRLHHIPSGPKGLFNPKVLRSELFIPGDDSPSQSQQAQELLMVVEGGFDALTLLEAGYHRVVALIGTSLLKPDWFRHQQAVGLAFDRDDAGQRATERAMAELKRYGIACYVLDWSLLLGTIITLLPDSSTSVNSAYSLLPKDLAGLWQHELTQHSILAPPTHLLPLQKANSFERNSFAQSWLRRVLSAMVPAG
jgi:hypothetical protein